MSIVGEIVALVTLALGLIGNAIALGKIYGVLKTEVEVLKEEKRRQDDEIRNLEYKYESLVTLIGEVNKSIIRNTAVLETTMASIEKIVVENVKQIDKLRDDSYSRK